MLLWKCDCVADNWFNCFKKRLVVSVKNERGFCGENIKLDGERGMWMTTKVRSHTSVITTYMKPKDVIAAANMK